MNEETKLYVPALVENTVEQRLFGRLKSYWKICMKLDICSSQGAPVIGKFVRNWTLVLHKVHQILTNVVVIV
jgi:hypothetical protein